jgi:hypothetical protein
MSAWPGTYNSGWRVMSGQSSALAYHRACRAPSVPVQVGISTAAVTRSGRTVMVGGH